nr:Chain C, Rhoptry neck protein 2 [Plasmodium falciparum]
CWTTRMSPPQQIC